MVDVTSYPGIGGQIWLVAKLRCRLLRNSIRKKNNLLDLIGLIASGIFGATFVLAICFAFFVGAYKFLSGGHEGFMALLFWGVFLFWQGFPIFAAGFGASFEFRALLRFPLRLTAFYVIGLAYGLADVGAISSLCWLIAMTIGAAAAKPSVLLVLVPIVLLFVLMNVTLERLIGSWLERLLARRRTRELFYVLFVLAMISLQFIQPLLRHYGMAARPWAKDVLPYLALFPGSLAGRAVAGSALGQMNAVLLGAAGLLLYTLLFSGLLWLRFASQYRGEELSETIAAAHVAARPTAQRETHADALAVLSPQVAAVVRKEFRYLTRNSFAIFLLFIPIFFVVLFSVEFTGRHPTVAEHAISSELFFPGMIGYLILILMSPAYNCFAYESKGIQVYYTAPVRFRDILLGKNLMLVSMISFEVVLTVIVFSCLVALPSPPILTATLMAVLFVVVGQLSIANWSSLSFPRKLQFGQMRGQRQSGMAVLVAFGAQILLGAICAPILFIGRWTGNRWLPAEVFAFLALAALGGYSASLNAMTQLAEKKKETLIEALCR